MRTRTIIAAACVAISAAIAGPASGQGAGMEADMAVSQSATIGDLVITQGWARATPPGAATGAGYMTITNNGDMDDRLVAVRSEIALVAEIHEMSMDGDRMVMRPLDDGQIIPAGETIVLRPGGVHVMLINLEAAIEENVPIDVTLVFDIAGEATISLATYPIGSPGPDGAAMDMDGMDMDGIGDEAGP